MTTSLSNLLALLSLDDSAYLRGLDRSKKATDTFAGNIGNSLTRAGGHISSLGKGLSLGITAPIVGAGTASITAASDFQASMQQIVGLVGESQDQVDAWGKQILQLAPQLGKTPQELAQGLYFVTSSGVDASQAMDVLTASAKASSAGLGDTQGVANAVTSVMNAYGAGNTSAAQATDVLVNAVKYGKAEASDLVPVIGNVTAVAAQMGVSFNDVGAALAAQTDLGIDAGTAATQLQQVFQGLLKTTPAAEKAFNNVGLSSDGLRQELQDKGLLATLQTLQTAFGGNTQALSKAFPNIRAFRGILALTGKNSATVADVFNGMADSTGALDAAFGAASDTTKFKWNQAMAQLQSLLITVGNTLQGTVTPIIQQFTGYLQQAVTWFQNLDPAMQRNIVLFAGIAAVVGPVLMVVGTLITALGAIIPIVLSPIGLAIIAIVAAVGLLYAAWTNNWGGIRDTVAQIWTGLQPVFSALQGWLAIIIPAALAVVQVWWNNFLTGAQALWAFLNTFVFPILGAIADVLSAVLSVAFRALVGILEKVVVPALQKVWEWFDAHIMPTIRSMASWLSDKLAPAFKWVADRVGDLVDWLHKLARGLRNISLPDWMTPGSPTPWEIGLVGVQKALTTLSNSSLPQFQTALQLQPVGVAGAALQPVSVSGATGGNSGGRAEDDSMMREIYRMLRDLPKTIAQANRDAVEKARRG